jgi:hypothetical protein
MRTLGPDAGEWQASGGEPPSQRLCMVCGRQLDADASFCSGCGRACSESSEASSSVFATSIATTRPRSKPLHIAVLVGTAIAVGAITGFLLIGRSNKTALSDHHSRNLTTPTTHAPSSALTIKGIVLVDDANDALATVAQPCPVPEYVPDVVSGASVTVTDQSGTIVGTTNLAQGQVIPSPDAGTNVCALPFTVTAPTEQFYEVVVGQQSAVNFSLANVLQDLGAGTHSITILVTSNGAQAFNLG